MKRMKRKPDAFLLCALCVFARNLTMSWVGGSRRYCSRCGPFSPPAGACAMTAATRRQFLHSALAAGTALAVSQVRAAAIEPFRRPGPPRLRLSLAAYSYNRYLDLRRQKKPSMTLEQFIDGAGGLPLDAVELTAYYFRETTPRYLASLKGRCTRLGLDVSGTAVGNNFTTTSASRLKEQIAHVKSWIEHTSRLGGKTMRIF